MANSNTGIYAGHHATFLWLASVLAVGYDYQQVVGHALGLGWYGLFEMLLTASFRYDL